MRRVDAEEAAAIGAQLLDGYLTGRRAHRQALVSALQGQCVDVVAKVLWHALPDQKHRQHDTDRQQAVERGAGHVGPEVTQALR